MLRSMKPIKYTVFTVALICLMGCTTAFRPWLLSDVKEGMDREQVVSILGSPDSSEIKDGAEYLYYTYAQGYNPSFSNSSIEEDIAFSKMRDNEIKESFAEYKYAVKLVDGKLQGYKEITE